MNIATASNRIVEGAKVRTFDASMLAVMIAGACTFLIVYSTQPLLPFLRRTFNASEMQVSMTISAVTLAVAISAPITGLLAEAIGRKRIIVPALFGLTIPTLMAATATSLHMFIFWRFVQGLFVPGIIAVMMAYIGEEWAGRGVGFAMSAYMSGTVLGGFLGRFISSLVTAHWQWRSSFILLGIINLIGAIIVRKWLPPAENFVPSSNWRAALTDVRLHLRNPRLLAVFAMGFTILFSLVGTFTYVNFYLAAPPFGLNSAALGSIFFVYLLGLIVTPLSGKFLDRVGFPKTSLLALGFTIIGLLFTLFHSLPLIIIGLALFSSGVFVSQSSATVQTGVVAGRARSSAAGLYVTFYYVGGSCGATFLAWSWLSGGWPGCVSALIVAAMGTLIFGFLSRVSPENGVPSELVDSVEAS